MVYRWMCYNLGGGGGGRAYKRRITVFLIVIIEARTQVSGFELSGRSIRHYYSDDWV